MRLWHKDLLSVLPRQQLLGQWRECCAIAKNIAEKGTPKHVLVNKIMDYPMSHFYRYCGIVCDKMIDRGYKVDWKKLTGFEDNEEYFWNKKNIVPYDVVFSEWHDYRYLRQCYYNLQEKYDCKAITEEEWEKIDNHMV